MEGAAARPERVFLVRGRVQGVGFRWWTRSLAQRLGVTGSVRNRPDGSVEVRAGGEEAALAELRRSLWQGPPDGQVEAVEESEGTTVAPDGFHILR